MSSTPPPSSFRSLAHSSYLVLTVSIATSIGCASGTTPGSLSDADAGEKHGDSPVGSACSSDLDCSGPGTPRCFTEIRPLAHMEVDPSFQALGVSLPGGYCSSEPSCRSDADCGVGGKCFLPLMDVDQATLDGVSAIVTGIDIEAFHHLGLCLAPCTRNDECRPDYVCNVPFGEFVPLLPGARIETYCIGDPVCKTCDAHASCDRSTSPSHCTCNTGYVGSGTSCFPDPCRTNPCQNGGACVAAGDGTSTCTCPDGFTGPACATKVDCGAPSAPTNGSVATPAGTTFGATATYACDPGFALDATATRTCQADGTWSGAAPSCL